MKGRELVGKKFYNLMVLSEIEKPHGVKDNHKYYLCLCDCGNTTVISSGNVGRTKSCGCEKFKSKPKTHGFATHKQYDKIYHTWTSIKYRCYNSGCKDYAHYGGRGIRMCETWEKDFMAFREWCLNNGFAENLTIDRIDVDGNYEPSNCRWVTTAEQNRNKTTTRKGD